MVRFLSFTDLFLFDVHPNTTRKGEDASNKSSIWGIFQISKISKIQTVGRTSLDLAGGEAVGLFQCVRNIFDFSFCFVVILSIVEVSNLWIFSMPWIFSFSCFFLNFDVFFLFFEMSHFWFSDFPRQWEHRIFAKIRKDSKDFKPRRQSNQQELDQHCQRPEKMGSVRRKLHFDRVKMTTGKMKTQSSSQNRKKMRRWLWAKQQLRNRASLCKQQHEAYESSCSRTAVKNFAMGWRLRVKNCATASPQRWRYWLRIPRTKERKFGWESGATDELRYSVTSSSGVGVFLVSLAGLSPSWLPWLLWGCCSESEDSVFSHLWLQLSNSLCVIQCLFSVFWVHLRTRCTAHCP